MPTSGWAKTTLGILSYSSFAVENLDGPKRRLERCRPLCGVEVSTGHLKGGEREVDGVFGDLRCDGDWCQFVLA